MVKGKIGCHHTNFEMKTQFINKMIETEIKYFGTGLQDASKNINEVQIEVKKNENILKRRLGK